MYTCVGEQSRSLCPTRCGEFRVEERCAHPSAVDSVHPDTKLGDHLLLSAAFEVRADYALTFFTQGPLDKIRYFLVVLRS